jgi:peptidoglycan/LPS O-acetylase OafA/YrhL
MNATAPAATKPRSLTHPKYRPDIDGLRAVAVLAVVAFHAFPGTFKGGFIGVDVFFVISGFLISSIIFSNLEHGSFSIVEFYNRRIRRIFPALIVVLIATFAFGWSALIADEYKQLGKHIAGGAGFVSNFILWNESGYFDNTADTKPLLHLWSLGIEEQFYIFWPLLLAVVWKKSWSFLRITLLIAVISFALNIYLVAASPIAAFYSPLTRFWELMIGGVLAYIALHRPELTGRYNNAQSILGLALLATGFLLINEARAFPGWWALLPTLGSFFLISAGPTTWLNRRVLSSGVLVWFGVLSYPLYLWHWPLFSFARIVSGIKPTGTIRIAAVSAAIILAWLTVKLIEKPFRFGARGARKSIALLFAMSVVGLVGWTCFNFDGFRLARYTSTDLFLFNRDQLEWNTYKSPGCTSELGVDAAFCVVFGNTKDIQAAVIGDSTGNALAPGLAGLFASSEHGLVNLGSHGCPPIHGVTSPWIPNCPEVVAKSYDWIARSQSIRIAVLSIFSLDLRLWRIPGVPPDATLSEKIAALKPLLNRDIADLNERGVAVVISYDVPDSPIKPRDCLARPLSGVKRQSCDVDEAQLADRQVFLQYFDQLFRDRDDVCVFRQSDLLISEGHLRIVDSTGRLLLRDPHHLSYYGSDRMAELFKRSRCFKTGPGSAGSGAYPTG